MTQSTEISNPTPKRSFDRTDIVWMLLIGVIILSIDLGSKYFVVKYLKHAPPVEVIPGFLQLTYGENPGIAFGLFQDHGEIMHFVTPLAFLFLLYLLYKHFAQQKMNWLLTVTFGFIIGGALGNIIDRLYHGFVVDFIDAYYGTYHWYTFNLADSALTIGEVLLIWVLVTQYISESRQEKQSAETIQTPE